MRIPGKLYSTDGSQFGSGKAEEKPPGTGGQRMKHNNIILTGFMGSGKTTVGLRLSYKLRMPVEDTDKLIERREGCSVTEIFARKGEDCFRELETALLRELTARKQGCIFSVGGGTPVRAENRKLLRQLGKVVYLRVRPDTVYERLKGDNTRPLLQCGNPRERIRCLMESRREAYESAAHLILDGDDMSIEDIVEALKYYIEKTNRRVTIEYLLLDGVNDTIDCAKELAHLIKGLNAYVNLIPYNETSHIEYKKSKNETVMQFYDTLKKLGINVTVRREFGGSIDAACGQLRASEVEK